MMPNANLRKWCRKDALIVMKLDDRWHFWSERSSFTHRRRWLMVALTMCNFNRFRRESISQSDFTRTIKPPLNYTTFHRKNHTTVYYYQNFYHTRFWNGNKITSFKGTIARIHFHFVITQLYFHVNSYYVLNFNFMHIAFSTVLQTILNVKRY